MMVDMPDPIDQISRRVFLHGALAVASSAIIAPGPDVADGAAAKAPSQVEVQNLGGSLWRVHQGKRVIGLLRPRTYSCWSQNSHTRCHRWRMVFSEWW